MGAGAEQPASGDGPGGVPTRCGSDTRRCQHADPKLEPVSWGELMEWWPHRPVLAHRGPMYFGSPVEGVFAGSDSGGRTGDPRTQRAYTFAYYQVPGSTLAEGDTFAVVSAGGMAIMTVSYPPGFPLSPGLPASGDFVRVRGRQAILDESPNQDFRIITYYDSLSTGHVVSVSFLSSVSKRSREQALAWAEQLNDL